eukprot:c21676_g1_i2 orf=624-1877(-)
MPIKGLICDFQDMKGGLNGVSRRSFDAMAFEFQRMRPHSAAYHERAQKTDGVLTQQHEQSCWATMPSELLRDIIRRVDECRSTWPLRIDVVACASVCRAWREATKDVVECAALSGKLTFPISVRQPGPRDSPLQCFIKRDRTTSTYYLYLSLTASLAEAGKFLLAARRFKRATSSDYIISLDADDMCGGGETYVGKLSSFRSNFLGTKFTIHESHSSECGTVASINHRRKRVGPKQNAHGSPSGTFDVAHISYELNVLGKKGPRQMQCTLFSIPLSAVEESRSAPDKDYMFPTISFLRSQSTQAPDTITEAELDNEASGEDAPLTLKNKSPRWHEQLQCWCLNFKGRVTVASVKNFQLVAATESSSQDVSKADQEKVLLQFGKIGKDTFTMDYKYPLSAFQAFAICLSSFDTKLASE